jgi:hypothetical protein
LLLLALAAQPARAATLVTPTASLAVEGRYDQDLAGEGGGASTMLAPGLGLRVGAPTFDLAAAYSVDVHAYARLGPDAAGENHRVRASQLVALDRRTELRLSETGQRVYDPTEIARPGVVLFGGAVTWLQGDGELSHRFSERVTGAVGLGAERANFDAPSARDGGTLAPRAAATLAVSARDTATLRYRLQLFSWTGGTSRSHEPALAWTHRFARHLRLTLEAGPTLLDQDGGTSARAAGGAHVSWRRPRFELAAGASRGLVGAAGLEGPLEADVAHASAGYRLSRPLSVLVAGAVYRNGRTGSGERVATGAAGEARVEWELGEEFVARLSARRVAQDEAAGVGVSLSRNIFAAGLAWRFDGLPRR